MTVCVHMRAPRPARPLLASIRRSKYALCQRVNTPELVATRCSCSYLCACICIGWCTVDRASFLPLMTLQTSRDPRGELMMAELDGKRYECNNTEMTYNIHPTRFKISSSQSRGRHLNVRRSLIVILRSDVTLFLP